MMTRLALALALALSAGPAPDARAQSAPALAVQWLDEEIAIAGILNRLSAAPVTDYTVIRNVRIVDPVDARVIDAQSVITGRGRILWVGAAAEEPNVPDPAVIDGGGRYLSPGLTDMHVHSESASSWLLNIANGVTTIREMDGFPWMLAAREQANADSLLAPKMYVAGTIINALPMDGYAVAPRDAVDARRIVRQQAACGYDFIKVHNILPAPLFDAIAAEARREGMDLVGHVPHDMSVAHAVAQGMRTMEHLKGYLNDANLQIGETDYSTASAPNVWITPTLYSWRSFAPAAEMQAMMAAPAARFVPARTRASWAARAAEPDDNGARMQRNGGVLAVQIMHSLTNNGAQFLAGTDAAGYPFQTMGFALVEELRLLREAGVSNLDALRAATSAPAAAVRAETDFDRVRVGMRADLVLLDRDPLEDVTAYARNGGVMVRGRWLDRATLDAALEELAQLYANEVTPRVDRTSARARAQQVAALVEGGFVFNARVLRDAATELRAAGQNEPAAALARLGATPVDGSCAAIAR